MLDKRPLRRVWEWVQSVSWSVSWWVWELEQPPVFWLVWQWVLPSASCHIERTKTVSTEEDSDQMVYLCTRRESVFYLTESAHHILGRSAYDDGSRIVGRDRSWSDWGRERGRTESVTIPALCL